jgi:hypothetical protein
MNLTQSPGNRPYSPSWLDRLMRWIDHSPGRIWGFYLATLLGLPILINAIFWIDGGLPFGTIHPAGTVFVLFVAFLLGLYHYLTRVAARSLDSFRPLLELDDEEVARIHFDLAALPAWMGWLSAILGILFAALAWIGEPNPYGDLTPNTPLVGLADVAITAFLWATFLCVLLRTIRQLRMVRRLHSRVTKINLLSLGPAHAFSSLTARTGIGIVLLLVFSYLFDPSAARGVIDLATYSVCAVLAILAFVLPVIGIRDLIEREKDSALDRTTGLLQTSIDSLHQDVGLRDFSQAKETEAAIRALTLERDLYAKVSTWPWNPVVFRGFASALLLPLVLWLVTRLLERLL